MLCVTPVALEEAKSSRRPSAQDPDLHAFLDAGEDADQVRVDREDLAHATELSLGESEWVLSEVRHRLGRAHRPAPPSVTSAEYTFAAGAVFELSGCGSGSSPCRPRR